MALSNSQYEALMRIYNQRQFQNKREQDARIAEVYRRVPQVEALTDEENAYINTARVVLKSVLDLLADPAVQVKRDGYAERKEFYRKHWLCKEK